MAVADYLFEKGVGNVLFQDDIRVLKTRGRIRQVWKGDQILCSIRASDGFIVFNRMGAELVQSALKSPRLRVVVNDDAAPSVASGKSAFAKHILRADSCIRPAEEVFVVDSQDRLLATGRAVLSGDEMLAFETGVAVVVRRGFGSDT